MGNWLAVLDDDDRAEFFSDLRAATDLAEGTGDVAPIETELAAWRTTAWALGCRQLREVLTASELEPDDFTEVPRP